MDCQTQQISGWFFRKEIVKGNYRRELVTYIGHDTAIISNYRTGKRCAWKIRFNRRLWKKFMEAWGQSDFNEVMWRNLVEVRASWWCVVRERSSQTLVSHMAVARYQGHTLKTFRWYRLKIMTNRWHPPNFISNRKPPDKGNYKNMRHGRTGLFSSTGKSQYLLIFPPHILR